MFSHSLENLFRVFRDGKLPANTILQYLIFLIMSDRNPFKLKGYIAIKITSADLEKQGINNSSINNKKLQDVGLIQNPKEHRSVIVLGEYKTVSTQSGDKTIPVYYFEKLEKDEKEPITKKQYKEPKKDLESNNNNVKEITDFFAAFYRAKFQKKPIWGSTGWFKTSRTIGDLMKSSGFSIKFLQASIIIYFTVDDDFLKGQGYALYFLPGRIAEIRNIIEKNTKKYNKSEEDYCKILVDNIIKKYGVKKYKPYGEREIK